MAIQANRRLASRGRSDRLPPFLCEFVCEDGSGFGNCRLFRRESEGAFFYRMLSLVGGAQQLRYCSRWMVGFTLYNHIADSFSCSQLVTRPCRHPTIRFSDRHCCGRSSRSVIGPTLSVTATWLSLAPRGSRPRKPLSASFSSAFLPLLLPSLILSVV